MVLPLAFVLDILAQTLSQGINYGRTFVDGFRHQIHLQTITLHVTLITTERQTGSLMEAFIRNGDQQVPRRLSGYMENVRRPPLCLTPPDSIFFVKLARARLFFGLCSIYSLRRR